MRRPALWRAIVILAAAVAVGIAAFGSLDRNESAPKPLRSENTIRLEYAYSTNQEDLLEPLIGKFNAEAHESNGRQIVIAGEGISSGEAEAAIAAGELRATLWSPASSLWGRLLNFEVDGGWVADENPALVQTPLVIAMWKPAAEALGWPRKPIGFAKILELATSRAGWARYGLPEFGAFKLGHTNPDFSTSGLSFVAAQYYNATGKLEGLAVEDVEREAVRRQVREIEQSIVHYGDTSSFFVDQMQERGPGYVSAVAMEEVTLLDYNETRPAGSLPLVAVYPAEGTFYFDNPLITVAAPWVDDAHAQAAELFKAWLLPRMTPELAARYGYRPRDRTALARAPIDRAHFVDPRQPRRVLALPEPRVLATVKRVWHEDRKPANVEIVVDVSGSMQDEEKLLQAIRGLKTFLGEFSPRDRVGLVTFDERVHPIVPLRPMRENNAALTSAVSNLVADGNTAVYDATAYGVQSIAGLNDTTKINAVVVLTDGEDNRSRLDAGALIDMLRRGSEDEESRIRVFTIAYGQNANRDVLNAISTASGGLEFEGDPDEIAAVYTQISSYF